MNECSYPATGFMRLVTALCCVALLAGCQTFASRQASLPAPVSTHEFNIGPGSDDVIGEVRIIRAQEQDTFPDIARRFNIGFEELVSANPGVSPWTPGAGTEIVLPTLFVLPDAPRKGIVINLAAMRLFYFPKAKPGEPQRVITHPLGIGRVEWKTPTGTTKVVAKSEAPAWIPTPSIRKEHAENGDPLPAVVPPGPDNPMGTHALRLGWPTYAIHGTNKPPSIGLRGTHGCLRMYPEDIVRMYSEVPVGTPVRVVNQPALFGWRGNLLYMQSYPVLEDDKRDQATLRRKALVAALKPAKLKHGIRSEVAINRVLIDEMVGNPRAIAIPVSQAGMTLESYLSHAERVDNRLPLNATWMGEDRESLD